MNEIPKVAFSASLTSADWGETTIATGDLADTIERLKLEHSGGYLLAQGTASAEYARRPNHSKYGEIGTTCEPPASLESLVQMLISPEQRAARHRATRRR